MMVRCCVCLAVLLSGSGCAIRRVSVAPVFRDYYERARAVSRAAVHKRKAEPLLTLSADRMALRDFLRVVADEAHVSIVAEASLDDKPVVVEVVDQPVSQVLGMVARRLGVQVTRVGHMFYLGSLRPEDKGVLVRRVGRLSKEELESAVAVLLSEFGRLATYADGLLVVGDRVEVLERIDELLRLIEDAPSGTWVVQVYLVEVNSSGEWEVGFDGEPALDVAYTFARTSELGLSGSLVLNGGLSAVLRAVRSSDAGRVVAEPMWLMLDGETVAYSEGERVPVPKRTVSDAGTVSTADFVYVEAGLDVKVSLRELGGESARLAAKVRRSAVVRMVEEAPVTSEQRVDASAVVQSGGVYLLARVDVDESHRGATGALGLVSTGSDRRGTLQVWARVYRIGGAVPEHSFGQPARTELNTDRKGQGTPKKK